VGHREDPAAGLVRNLRERVGLAVEETEYVGAIEHLFTHRRLRLHLFRCDPPRGRTRLAGFDAHRWISPRSLADLPHAAATAKAIALLGGEAARSGSIQN
jgi:adenine-specific DNA glycosylase